MMRPFLILILLFTLVPVQAQNSQPFPIQNANWTATDALGRKVPEFSTTGPVKKEKWVGLFYYIWHGSHTPNDTVYDITKILKQNPAFPLYGPRHHFHFWGEPEADYYYAGDPWVIRRNIAMMATAGIDFIYFDVTNAFTYLAIVDKYCEISMEMRRLGINAPYISFMTNSSGGKTMNSLYDEFYSKQKYQELWFYWEGKPLIFGQPADPVLRAEVKEFFNIKYSWAWTDAQNQPNHWQWIDKYPQDYGWSVRGTVDQIPVAVASHPTSNIGNSFSKGIQPAYDQYKLTPFTGQGLHFAEQWKQVFALQPKVVMITQFNEWMAQRFINGQDQNPPFLGVPPANGNTYFVDAFNEEYNRDIEPMKDGHTDNMYYQMISYVRLFKGMEEPEQGSQPQKINIDGKFSEWKSLHPVYHDYEGDTLHRNSRGSNKNTTYLNNTGRNDIVESRVSFDNEFVYFYARTARPLTPHTGKNWMLLYLNTDTVKSTGWEGYDYLVNAAPTSVTSTSVSKYENGAWKNIQTIRYAYSGNELELAIPVSIFPGVDKHLVFSFHWADNCQNLMDIREFFINGDSAPDRRFDYLFTAGNISSSTRINENQNKIRFYPNPAKKYLNLQWPGQSGEKLSYSIHNLLGESICSGEVSGREETKTLDLSGIPDGLYVIRLNTQDTVTKGKLQLITE